jgi:ABC-type glycerol-3-phosphate transport system permease component
MGVRVRPATVTLHAVLLTLVAASLCPFLWFVSIALRPISETYVIPMPLLPHSLTLQHFRDVFRYVPLMALYYRNSFVITGAAVAGVVAISCLAGYFFARLRGPGKEVLFWAVVLTMFVPPLTAVPALYELLDRLHLLNTLAGLILVYIGWHLGMSTFIMRGIFAQVPRELEEAARIDGASNFRIFSQVMLPLVTGGLVVVAIFSFVPIWGEYIFAYTFTQTKAIMPMSVAIRFFEPSPASGQYTLNVAAAAALFMFLPAIAIYIGLQKWFTRGLLEGALKF